MSLHRDSGQAVVRFREAGDPRVGDVYLGIYGTSQAGQRYAEEIAAWIERALEVGWCPDGWEPARTGHEGVLTVGGLVEGYRRYLDGIWGRGWRQVVVGAEDMDEYRKALERAWGLMRRGRWEGDPDQVRDGRRLKSETRHRFEHLEADLGHFRTARMLTDLHDAYGSLAAAAFGDRELRALRRMWHDRGCSLAERKQGNATIRDAFVVVIGRRPKAPHDCARGFLEANPHLYGLDVGSMGSDGRWAKSIGS